MASGKYLLAKYVDCPISLVYEADSVRDGSVTFYYENNDESLLFSFEVQLLKVCSDQLNFDKSIFNL